MAGDEEDMLSHCRRAAYRPGVPRPRPRHNPRPRPPGCSGIRCRRPRESAATADRRCRPRPGRSRRCASRREYRRFHQQDMANAELPRQPDRQAIGSYIPAFRNIRRAQGHAARQPDGRHALVLRCRDRRPARGRPQPRLKGGQHQGELLHGQDRHVMGGLVGKGPLPLGDAHRIGEGAAAGDEDRASPATREMGEPGRNRWGDLMQAAAQLDHHSSAEARLALQRCRRHPNLPRRPRRPRRAGARSRPRRWPRVRRRASRS